MFLLAVVRLQPHLWLSVGLPVTAYVLLTAGAAGFQILAPSTYAASRHTMVMAVKVRACCASVCVLARAL